MSEKSLVDAIGIDRSAEEALSRAGVRTVEELRAADAESLAAASGVPVDRVREWQGRAARAVLPRKARNPVVTGWLVAILGLLLAVLIGWAMMAIGARRVEQAEQVRQKAESRLLVALDSAVALAADEAKSVDDALLSSNWGSAGRRIPDLTNAVTLMDQVAPEGKRQQVDEVRELLSQLQGAIGDQSKDARDRLDAFRTALDGLRMPEPEE